MDKQILDYTLVPAGLLMLVGYHIWLLYKVRNHPYTTVIGFEAVNRRIWVSAMMQDSPNKGALAVQILTNYIMASNQLASLAIMIASVIIALMSNNGSYHYPNRFVYGDTSNQLLSLKVFSIVVCLLLAFSFSLQSTRCYSNASLLINVSLNNQQQGQSDNYLTMDYVGRVVNRGEYFWTIGLRVFYFSFPLFVWTILGPIVALASCLVLVFSFYFLDVTSEFSGVSNASEEEDDHHHPTEDVENNNVVLGVVSSASEEDHSHHHMENS